jgi:hypothetical protein
MTWTDAQGRDWQTTVTVTTVQRVQQLADVLLTDAADGKLIDRLYSDVCCLANVLNAVCRPQADQRGVTSEQFGELLAGDVLDRACDSLMDDLIRFFPSSRRRAVEIMVTAAKKLEAEQTKLIGQKLTTEQLDQMIRHRAKIAADEIDRHLATLGDLSGEPLA